MSREPLLEETVSQHAEEHDRPREPPEQDRWDDALLDRLQLRRATSPLVRTIDTPGAGVDELDGLVVVFTAR